MHNPDTVKMPPSAPGHRHLQHPVSPSRSLVPAGLTSADANSAGPSRAYRHRVAYECGGDTTTMSFAAREMMLSPVNTFHSRKQGDGADARRHACTMENALVRAKPTGCQPSKDRPIGFAP